MVSPATIRGFIVLLAILASIVLQFKDIPKRLTPSVVKRESTVIGGRCVDLFCPPYPNRSNNSVDRRGLAYRIIRQCSLSSTGRAIICGEMPFGKFEHLAGCAVAPHGGAFEIW